MQNPSAPNGLIIKKKSEEEKFEGILKSHGRENPFQLWEEMGQWMTDNVTVIRYNEKLKQTDAKLLELKERLKDVNVGDKTHWANQAVVFTRQLANMLELARIVTLGALRRNESRGSHFKPDFPDRDDANWLKTTVAKGSPEGPQFFDEPVNTSLIKPKERKY